MVDKIEMKTEAQVMDAVLILHPEWTRALQDAEDAARVDMNELRMTRDRASWPHSREVMGPVMAAAERVDRLAMAREALVRMANIIGERREADAPEPLSAADRDEMLQMASRLREASKPLLTTLEQVARAENQPDLMRAAADLLSRIAAPVTAQRGPLKSNPDSPDEDAAVDQWSAARDLQRALVAANSALAAAHEAGLTVTAGVGQHWTGAVQQAQCIHATIESKT